MRGPWHAASAQLSCCASGRLRSKVARCCGMQRAAAAERRGGRAGSPGRGTRPRVAAPLVCCCYCWCEAGSLGPSMVHLSLACPPPLARAAPSAAAQVPDGRPAAGRTSAAAGGAPPSTSAHCCRGWRGVIFLSLCMCLRPCMLRASSRTVKSPLAPPDPGTGAGVAQRIWPHGACCRLPLRRCRCPLLLPGAAWCRMLLLRAALRCGELHCAAACCIALRRDMLRCGLGFGV